MNCLGKKESKKAQLMPFVIVNNLKVEKVDVLSETKDYVTVLFSESGGAARIRRSRIYQDRDEAENRLMEIKKSREAQPRVPAGKMPNRE